MRFCVLMLVCLLAGSAVAQPIDTDPNGISVYFDEGAQVYCTDAEVGTQITAYLCLTNASDTSGFLGWEARLESSVPDALLGFDLRGDASNTATAPEFMVEFGTPLPYSASTVLMEITIDVVWEWSIALRVWPPDSPSGPDNLPSYTTTLEPSSPTSLQYLFGWNQDQVPNWSAAINNPGCIDLPSVPGQDTSWSSVKALYR